MSASISIRDRAAALAGEVIALKREAALAGDQAINQRLKEATRILKYPRGEFSETAYDRLKERLADELYGSTASAEHVVQARKESLTENVRRTVIAELQAEHADLEAKRAEQEAALEGRELAVAARERKASPFYRARFATAGAALALSADLLIRTVA
jgi:hypothetical protein